MNRLKPGIFKLSVLFSFKRTSLSIRHLVRIGTSYKKGPAKARQKRSADTAADDRRENAKHARRNLESKAGNSIVNGQTFFPPMKSK